MTDHAITHVSLEDYLAHYAADFYEWHDGELLRMPPVTDEHDLLSIYFRNFFDAYFISRPIGVTRNAPFAMRLGDRTVREPDVQVILNDNSSEYTKTGLRGPADICVEIVSPESTPRDYGVKFTEYESFGVGEYWIIDPQRRDAIFYRLNITTGHFVRMATHTTYETPLLPDLVVDISVLWQDPLPNMAEILDAVREMLS